MAEVVAEDEPFSTFSLNVSDVSFKLAKTALLENNSFPDSAKVRVEEFVNAMHAGTSPALFGEYQAPDGRTVKTVMTLMAGYTP